MGDARQALIFFFFFFSGKGFAVDVDGKDGVGAGADVVHVGVFGGSVGASPF